MNTKIDERGARNLRVDDETHTRLDEAILRATAPHPFGLVWTAEHVKPVYVPVESWTEIDLLLMRVGFEGFDFVIVVDQHRGRFAQAMGDPEGMIIEVCAEVGHFHPAVWRVRRPMNERLAHAELTSQLFEGDGVHPDTLFTASEAAGLFREWLTSGSVGGFDLETVVY